MQRGTPEHELWLRSVDPNYRGGTERKAEPPAPVARAADEISVSMSQLRTSLLAIAATIAPLGEKLDRLEKRLRALESRQADGLSLAQAVIAINATLSQPVRPIFDESGRIIEARRVPAWETN